MIRQSLRLLVALSALMLLAACGTDDDAALMENSRRVFGTLDSAAARLPEDPQPLIALGRHLYFSTALSENHTQSCNSCHPIDGSGSGADGRPTSSGAHGTPGRRNSPTVLNAGLQFAQFWDGRAATLEQRAAGPMMNPAEMAMADATAVAARLHDDPAIDRTLFRAAFPADQHPYTVEHAARAIAAFERTLRTRDRFDDFQNGDRRALTPIEKKGLRRFMAIGCTSCHNGPLLGGKQFQKLGIVHAYETPDRGRYELTKSPGDEYVFKVPTLRNVALTGPYFHDGRVLRLPGAVERMAWHQLGMKIEPEDRDAIVAFLRALSRRSEVSGRRLASHLPRIWLGAINLFQA